MKKIFIFITAIIIILLGCNDPVFYEVSMQEKIKSARIKGSPTALVEFSSNKKMYVASGSTIHYYDTDDTSPTYGKWSKSSPGLGRITFLAGTTSILYALTNDGVYECSNLDTLSFSRLSVSGNYWFLSMYSANGQIFVGARQRSNDNYYIFYVSGSSLTRIDLPLNTNSKPMPLLKGVAYIGSNYYLCVKDDYKRNWGGIFKTSSPFSTATLIGDYTTNPFMGITNITTSKVVAIARNGRLFEVTSDEVKPLPITTDDLSNGTLYLDTADSVYHVLLAGRIDSLTSSIYSGYSYGYLEAVLEDGDFITGFSQPGRTSYSTLTNREKYRTTIGKYPIKFFHRSSDGILFASTLQEGLWSLRDGKWNTEQ